ncbi:MAG TPA: hypothetical protein VJ276_12850, partial [Thermoanaerobaculia bacterium]|nr:hypothetical protein [Thermoanaerobaculia bacterium]
QTHLLRSIEQQQDDPILGTVPSSITFSNYREGFPTHRVETTNGIVVRELDCEVTIDGEAPDFALPKGWTMPRADAPPQEEIRKLADGVWADTARGNALFVEMADHVVAIEAPNSIASAQTTIDAIHRTIPDKPIRYFAFTHPHSDHAGGTAAYVNAGATIITTPANVRWVNALAHLTRKPVIETVKSTRTLKDATHTIELFALRTSHVEEQLFAWLPKERILFQADLFFAAATGPIGPQFPHTLRELRAALARRGIKDIKYVIDPDGRIATGEEFAAATPHPPSAPSPRRAGRGPG